MSDEKKLPVLDKNLKFQIILSATAFMHLTFLTVFLFTERYMMMTFNIFSVILYAAGAICCINKSFEKHSIGWIIATFSEIVLHATLCTIMMGLEVFFFLYLMVIIPVAGYSIFFYVDKKSFNKLTGIFTVVTILAITVCIVFENVFGFVYELAGWKELSDGEIRLMQIINIAFTVVVLFSFTFLFYIENRSLIGQLNEINQKLEFTAAHDELTGLFNRHSLWKYFYDLLESKEHYCVALGDLDNFKRINDTYGHECGDLVLKSVAEIILNQMSKENLACRWGGEEMLLIMRGDSRECFYCVENIRKQICGLDIIDEGRHVNVSMTFGFADCNELSRKVLEKSGQNADDPYVCMDRIIAIADKKLYSGKENGKNVVVK